MLRKRSLIVLLENNQYLRRSLRHFIESSPEIYNEYKNICEKEEAYEMLSTMINSVERVDQEYMLWLKYKQLALVLPLKDMYSVVECHVLSQKTGIPFADFEAMTVGY